MELKLTDSDGNQNVFTFNWGRMQLMRGWTSERNNNPFVSPKKITGITSKMKRLNITSTVLDKLGFSEYWDEDGTWGGRTLTFSNGQKFRIMDTDEQDDGAHGYDDQYGYVAQHYCFAGWFAIPKLEISGPDYFDLFFLDEMRDVIRRFYPDCLKEFVQKCQQLKMGGYLNVGRINTITLDDPYNSQGKSTIYVINESKLDSFIQDGRLGQRDILPEHRRKFLAQLIEEANSMSVYDVAINL